MTNRKRLLVVGVATFILGAVLMFPARLAYSWFVPDTVKLNGISGTVWSGKANEGSASGLYFTSLNWTFRPLALFTGKLKIDAELKTTAGPVSGAVAAGLTGALTFTDLAGSLALASVHPALQSNGIGGQLNVRMDRLVLDGGLPVEAAGKITVANLTARAWGTGSLGNFSADVSTDDNEITALVEDVGAIIGLSGTITLTPDRAYLFSGFVSANDETPAALNRNLRLLGSPDASGRRQFRFEGAL